MRAHVAVAAVAALAAADALAPPNSLRVVGCGVLGRSACRQWRAKYPDATIVGETATASSHAELLEAGAAPATRAARTAERSAHVIFCAPPKPFGDDEYAAEVAAAARDCWDGSGGFVFCSSGGVFAEDGGGVVDEAGAVSETPRAKKMLGAEAAAVAAGGCAVRLAGLYTRDRGAHAFWYAKGAVAASPGSSVNLLHYDDAAAFALAALEADVGGEVLLAADGAPRSRAGIVDAVAAHPLYRDRPRPTFEPGAEPPRRGPAGAGKVYDCAASRAKVGWAPAFASIDAFFEADAAAPCEVADRLP